MARVKTQELRGKKKEELLKMLDEQKNELASLKVHLSLPAVTALPSFVDLTGGAIFRSRR